MVEPNLIAHLHDLMAFIYFLNITVGALLVTLSFRRDAQWRRYARSEAALAGVSRDVIAADYAASQARLQPLYEQLLREVGDEARRGFWFKPVTTPKTMHDMLAHPGTRYLTATGLNDGNRHTNAV